MIDVGRYPGSQTVIGQIMRAPLRLIPRDTVVPILRGPLRGKRWIVGSGISRLWLGGFEPEKMRLAASLLHRGDVAFDIGANVGIYSLLFSACVGPAGQVVAFEPAPGNLRYLRRHLALNPSDNVSVVDAAVSDQSGQARFDLGEDSSTGRISAEGVVEVATIRLDDFVASKKCRPTLIKIDVEGGEVEVLSGASMTLRTCAPSLLVATHSEALKATCIELLGHHGYSAVELGAGELSEELLATPRQPVSRGGLDRSDIDMVSANRP